MIGRVLSIAGTDPTGGAGVLADMKTFSALGVYGMGVLTAVVAQNTRGVQQVQVLPAGLVTAQLDSVFDDIDVDAVKIGMLADADQVRAVAAVLRTRRPPHVVLDPVLVATSGDRLAGPDVVTALRDELIPLVDLITPNLPEAAALLGADQAVDEAGMAAQLGALARLGCAVLLKGGHLTGAAGSPDLLLTGPGAVPVRLDAPRVPTSSTHGTGCALSSALAALRPRYTDWAQTAVAAKRYVTGAVAAAGLLHVGSGHGPIHHLHLLWAGAGPALTGTTP